MTTFAAATYRCHNCQSETAVDLARVSCDCGGVLDLPRRLRRQRQERRLFPPRRHGLRIGRWSGRLSAGARHHFSGGRRMLTSG
jgi:hypothetical protein